MEKIKYIHDIGPSGPSPYFPSPSVSENDGSDGWPDGTTKVEWLHEDHCLCVVLDNGESYTVDIEGSGQDDQGDFYLGSNGIERA